MTDTNWPNPNLPGVPMFPERKAWHMLDRNVWEWCPSRQEWNDTVLHPSFVKAKDMAWRKYQGIVLTHTQITELQTEDQKRLDWLGGNERGIITYSDKGTYIKTEHGSTYVDQDIRKAIDKARGENDA